MAFTDSDWATDKDSRRSVSGTAVFYNGNLINWLSRVQKRTAGSSTEAEYLALDQTGRDVLYFRHLLEEMGCGIEDATTIFCDNQGAIRNAVNPLSVSKMKHVEVCYHMVRDFVEAGALKIVYVSTDENLADIFTKSISAKLSVKKFIVFRDQLLSKV